MTTERLVRMLAGSFILLSLALGVRGSPAFHDARWLWLTAFVGANLFQAALTNFCPLEVLLRKLGVKSDAELAE